MQELRVSLSEAEAELEETEYDKYISDTQQMLDDLTLQYSEILNTRLDNLDYLVEQMISEINTDASSISTIISDKADSVGYTLTDSMSTIWDTNSTKINSVITTYGDKFTTAQTTTNTALNTINTNLQNMIAQLNKIAKTNVKSASTSSSAGSKESSGSASTSSTTTTKPTTTSTPATKTISVGGKINAGSARIYASSYGTGGGKQYYGRDPIYVVLGENNGYLKVRYHKLSSGVTGWFRKSDVKAYKTGIEKILDNEYAWTQEAGNEFIVRPSDGAILTPLAKGDSVLNANASGNIWDMANNPTEFIRDSLGVDVTSIPNGSSVQNSYTQTIENVNFDLKNVKNYEQLLSSMQKDKNFERLILSMSIDQIAGKSALGKNKAIR